jgi:hypothetical protein
MDFLILQGYIAIVGLLLGVLIAVYRRSSQSDD